MGRTVSFFVFLVVMAVATAAWAETPPDDANVCTTCGSIFTAADKFCAEDGQALVPLASIGKRCPTCKATYPKTENFCANDGAKLELDLPKRTAGPDKPKTPGKVTMVRRCPQCLKIYPADTRFCPADLYRLLPPMEQKDEDQEEVTKPRQRGRASKRTRRRRRRPPRKKRLMRRCIRCGKLWPPDLTMCPEDSMHLVAPKLYEYEEKKP